MQVKEQQLEPDMEQLTVSKLGKEYVEAIYCHPAYLTYMGRNRKSEMRTNDKTIVRSSDCRYGQWKKNMRKR